MTTPAKIEPVVRDLATIAGNSSGNESSDSATSPHELSDQLRLRYTDASQSLRRVVAFGVFLWDLKENQLPHGQFGPFLKLHCPEFVSERIRDGKTVLDWRTLQHYMDLTKRVLELCGVQIRNTVADLKKGDFLFLPENQLSPAAKVLKEQICVIVDNKSQRQLMWNIGLSESKKTYHPRKPVTADQLIAAEDDNDTQLVRATIGDLLNMADSLMLCHVSHALRFELGVAAKSVLGTLSQIDGDPAAYASEWSARKIHQAAKAKPSKPHRGKSEAIASGERQL